MKKNRIKTTLTAAAVAGLFPLLVSCGLCLNPDQAVYPAKYIPGEWRHEGDIYGRQWISIVMQRVK